MNALEEFLAQIVDLLTEFGGAGIFCVLFLWLIYRSSMHAMYLYGWVEPTPEQLGTSRKVVQEYRYVFVIQNLENEEYRSLPVRLLPMPGAIALDPRKLRIFAGPKSITYKQVSVVGDEKKIGIEIFLPLMPAFDTWRIEIDATGGEVELNIGPQNEARILPRNLYVDVRPKRLRLDPLGIAHKFAGAKTTPSRFHRNLAVLVSVIGYLGVMMILSNIGWGQNLGIVGLSYKDGIYSLLVGFAVWAMAKLIERAIYPVMEGYQWQSLQLSKLESDEVKNGIIKHRNFKQKLQSRLGSSKK
jgi:hypothetical protein